MSIRFGVLDEERKLKPHVYASMSELFNPSINNVTFKASVFRWSRFEEIIKLLWTKENIIDNMDYYFNSLMGYPYNGYHHFLGLTAKEKYKFLFLHVPDEDAWMLAFTSFGLSGNGENFGYSFYFPDLRNNDSLTTHTYNTNVLNVSSIPISKIHLEEYKTKFLKTFNAAKDRWEKAFTESSNKFWSDENFYMVNNNFMQMFIRKTLGRMYVSYDGGTFNHGQILSLISEDSTSFDLVVSVNQHGMNTPRLVQKITKTNRRGIEKTLSYSTNICELLPYPMKEKNEYNPVFYGVELELATDYSTKELVNATEELFVIGKQDGTISGTKNNKVELVTIPASLKSHKIQWAKFFSKLKYENFDCTKQTNNGMHVHIGRTHFNGKGHVNRLAFFVNNPSNYNFFFIVSERTAANITQFTPFAKPIHNKGRSIARAIDNAYAIRGAVNVKKSETIEIRLFKGIVSYATILKNLEFVDSIFHFTKDASLSELTLKHYTDWLAKTHTNKYMVLKKFITEIKNLEKMIKASEVHDMVFLERDPKKMMDIIDKGKVVIDNDHVTALNKLKGVRTFVFNKTTKKMELHDKPLDGINSLNDELTSRYSSL